MDANTHMQNAVSHGEVVLHRGEGESTSEAQMRLKWLPYTTPASPVEPALDSLREYHLADGCIAYIVRNFEPKHVRLCDHVIDRLNTAYKKSTCPAERFNPCRQIKEHQNSSHARLSILSQSTAQPFVSNMQFKSVILSAMAIIFASSAGAAPAGDGDLIATNPS
ncbi:MAG: hypothetical protein Q9159_005923 [Coniocarpon cinnabarinum]